MEPNVAYLIEQDCIIVQPKTSDEDVMDMYLLPNDKVQRAYSLPDLGQIAIMNVFVSDGSNGQFGWVADLRGVDNTLNFDIILKNRSIDADDEYDDEEDDYRDKELESAINIAATVYVEPEWLSASDPPYDLVGNKKFFDAALKLAEIMDTIGHTGMPPEEDVEPIRHKSDTTRPKLGPLQRVLAWMYAR